MAPTFRSALTMTFPLLESVSSLLQNLIRADVAMRLKTTPKFKPKRDEVTLRRASVCAPTELLMNSSNLRARRPVAGAFLFRGCLASLAMTGVSSCVAPAAPGFLGVAQATPSGAQPQWKARDTPNNSLLVSASFADDQNGWAVGLNSLVHTQDGGRNWENQWKNRGSYWLNSVAALSPQVAVATSFSYGKSNAGVVLRTEDGGQNWQPVVVGNPESQFHSLQFRRDKKTGFLVSTVGGLMKTGNGGKTWNAVATPQRLDRAFIATRGNLSLPDDKTIYLGANDSVLLHSADDGATWDTIKLPEEAASGDRQFVWVRFADAKRGWVNPMGKDTWETSDGGLTWAKSALSGVPFFQNATNGWAIDKNSISRTTNGGQTWTDKTDLDVPQNVGLSALAFSPTRAYVVGGSEAHGLSFVSDRLLPGVVDTRPKIAEAHAPIPIRFTLAQAGVVTLVVEDAQGKRVRNLVSETPFPAGPNVVYWDGLDESGRINESENGIYDVQGKLVSAGAYQVRGLVHDPLDLRYEFTLYNAGQIPWATGNPASQWLTNHTPPSAILFLPPGLAPARAASPAKFGQLLVGSKVSEGGSGLAWIDTDGHKLNGQEWVGGVWTGASHLARDIGSNPVAGVYAYTGTAWAGDGYNGNKPELRLHELVVPEQKRERSGAWVNGVWDPNGKAGGNDTRMGSGEDRPLLQPNFTFSVPLPSEGNGLSGMAVRNGLLVASLPTIGQLLFVDARAHKVLGQAPLADAGGLAFDARGALLVLAKDRVLRFELPTNLGKQGEKITLPAPQVVVKSGLDEPQSIALDGAGQIYVSNRGALHQVKVFASNGTFVRSIGKAGVPKAGPYDPQRMQNPSEITIAQSANGPQLWVAEEDFQPKRLSVWKPDGTFVRAFYGPTVYGGGGLFDPQDKSRFFHDGMEIAVDWKTGENHPTNIYSRPQAGELQIPAGWNKKPETPFHVGNRLYLTNAYSADATNGSDVAGVWQMRSGVARLVAAAGAVGSWSTLSGLQRDSQNFSVRWSGQVQAPMTGKYTFSTLSDDGVRLWVDGKPLIANWAGHGPTEDKGSIEMEAGRRYDIKLEYYNGAGGGKIQLRWSGPDGQMSVIPTSNLFASTSTTKAGGLSGEYFNDVELRDSKGKQTAATIDFDYSGAAPAALLGDVGQFQNRLPRDYKVGQPLSFVWSDENDNGKIDPAELQLREGAHAGGAVVESDLSITLPDSSQLKAVAFTGAGVPRYDLMGAIKRFDWLYHPTSGGGQILDTPDGFSVAVAGPIQGFQTVVGAPSPLKWTYPNQWPGLHASHYARLASAPGEILGATHLLGPLFSLPSSDASDKTPFRVWGLNGNMGQGYLMTSDGLFVGTLFKDFRESKPWPDQAVREMPLNDVSMGGESFYNTINRTDDGRVYVQTSNRIVRVDGLDSLRRLPTRKINVSPAMLAQAQDYFVARDAARQKSKGAGTLTIALRDQAPVVDGKLDEWKSEDFVAIDVKTQAAAAVSGDTLYLAYKTGYPDLLKNKIESLPLVFKTGGALDLQIAANPDAPDGRGNPVEGDQRLLITRDGDKTVAVRYRAVVPGAKNPVPFASPSRTVSFDSVDNVSEQIRLSQGTAPIEEFHAGNVFGNRTDKYEGTSYEVAIPLSVLGLKATDGQSVRGDLGILIGNGFQTIQRVYWNNKATGLVSDIPGEAMLSPQLWGKWQFKKGN